MATANRCPEDDCPTLGVEAVSLDRYQEMQSREGELIVFDATIEDAWVQSDRYVPLETMR